MSKPNRLAPTYLEGFATYENEKYFTNVDKIEWRGQIKSSTGNTKIEYRDKKYRQLKF